MTPSDLRPNKPEAPRPLFSIITKRHTGLSPVAYRNHKPE